jgi:hypothetical protein
MPSLADHLPVLLPRILDWANAHAAHILRQGIPLTSAGVTLANRVGVSQPERIRILTVSAVPAPDGPELQQMALEQNLCPMRPACAVSSMLATELGEAFQNRLN